MCRGIIHEREETEIDTGEDTSGISQKHDPDEILDWVKSAISNPSSPSSFIVEVKCHSC